MICPKCKVDKQLTEYYAKKSHKGCWCKECMRASCRKWAAENPEKAKANKKKYNAANAEKVRAQSNARVTKFNALNPEKRYAYRNIWRENNPDKNKAANQRTKGRQISELRDAYIKKTLGIPDPPISLIELQRVRLRISRRVKEVVDGDNVKRCSRCGEIKPRDSFYRRNSGRDGLMSHCKICKNAAQVMWRKRNPERWAQLHYQSNSARKAALQKVAIEALSDNYVRHLIKQHTFIPIKSIPKELIELKRVHLQIKRQLKEMK